MGIEAKSERASDGLVAGADGRIDALTYLSLGNPQVHIFCPMPHLVRVL